MADPFGVAVVGCGTVGGGVADTLTRYADRLAARAGRPVPLRHVVVRDLAKRRPELPVGIVSTDLSAALRDPAVGVVCELIGGTTVAKDVVLAALAAGKHVVTANKALLAASGPELFAAARKAGKAVGFEAAVAGGVPIVRAIAESLAANQITAIQGILNGTSNFILSAMADRGWSYGQALAEAQRLGYAEADPTLDVDGSDAAHKLAVLAQLAFGVVAKPGEIERVGIQGVDPLDMKSADELGYAIKLLAEAWADGTAVALHVAPVMVRKSNLLAQVRGAFNAVRVVGDIVGETLYQGPGAGAGPTASAVVADILDLAVGRAQPTFAAANHWAGGRGYSVEPSERVRTRFYLRLRVADKPGVLADVARVLAEQSVSIASVVQHERAAGEETVPLVIVTHAAATARFRAAVAAIDRLPSVTGPAVHYSMDD